jgi:hypothetical protein
MKNPKSSVPFIILLTLIALVTAQVCRSQPLPENLVQITGPPPIGGIYWPMSLTNSPPSPFDPFPELDLYTDGTGNYYYDDRGVDLSALLAVMAGLQSQSGAGVMSADYTQGPPAPGGSNGGNGSGGTVSFVIPTYTLTCECDDWTNFWLVISNTATAAQVGISNTVPGAVYDILTNDDLSTTNWGVYERLVATSCVGTWASPFSFTNASYIFFGARLT